MTSSNIEQIFQAAGAAPTEELITEEVVIVKEANVDNLIYRMVELASYLYHLNIQAHLIHLNYENSNFLAVHEFLKEQYEQHVEDFDTIAELVRSMDYLLPMCQKGLLNAHKNFKTTKTYEPEASLIQYTKNLEEGGFLAKDVFKLAQEVEAPDVENEIATVVGHLFKGAWMLKATIRKGSK